MYIVIIIASVFGNSVIIHIIRTDNTMKTTTNYLILNQACADLLITMVKLIGIVIPFSFLGNQWFGGLFGMITCRAFQGSIFVATTFSIWIFVVIAVERFYAVVRPLISSPISRHLKKTVLLLWTWSVISSTNDLTRSIVIRHGEYYYCHSGTGWMTFHLVFSSALNGVLPLLIITILYIIVCRKLWSREVPGEGTNQNQGQAGAIKTAKKVTLMMIIIVVLYVVCWFPIDVYIIFVFLSHVEIDYSFSLFLIWLTVAFSGLNPYVYFAFSQNFRKGLKQVFGNCLRKLKIQNAFPFRSESVELEQM